MSHTHHSISDDLSYSRPLADHGTVGAIANAGSDISYDLSSGSEASSVLLDVKVTASGSGGDIIPSELICSNSKEGGHGKGGCDDADHHDDHHHHNHDDDDDGGYGTDKDEPDQEVDILLEEEPTLETIARLIESGSIRRILVLSGAGVSCSAGIPDFRTPGSGLYDNLEAYNLPYPEAVFDLGFYRSNPQPFVDLASELWPGRKHSPTLSHSFLALLDRKGLLKRNYTQNIDGLECLAGVSEEHLVECHGHFRTSSCIDCGIPFDGKMAKSIILETSEAPTCVKCGGLVKPDIVFFGESLPVRFKNLLHKDLSANDLLVVMGTSLKVAPVSLIPEMLNSRIPRLLLNRELVGDFAAPGTDGNCRDVFYQGDCDDSVRKLCSLLGWEDELLELNEATKIGSGGEE